MTDFIHTFGPTPYDILATSHVIRWHTVATVRHQTLADHLGKVALLVEFLGSCLGPTRYTPEVALEALRHSLTHDLPETEHGDIPAPAKSWLNGRLEPWGQTYDQHMTAAWWDARRLNSPAPSKLACDLVSVADILEACTWYWTFGIASSSDLDIRVSLVFETMNRCKALMPELILAVGDVLGAAGVPEQLIGEASA